MKDRFGLQLYSVREEIKANGFPTMLETVKRAGYDCVEFAGFYGYSPEEVVKLLKANGLEGISAHIGLGDIEAQLPYIDAIGIKYVYVPWLNYEDMCGEKLVGTIEKIKSVKKLLDKRGIVFGYHNHAHEYTGGSDKVFELVSAVDGFTSELDIFWAVAAGQSPTELMKKYGDKLSAVHIKEMDKRTKAEPREYPNAIVGEGKSDTKSVIKLAKDMGIGLFILEVEGFPCGVEEYLKKSCDGMKRLAAEA